MLYEDLYEVSKLLLAEDEPAVRRLVQRVLTRRGYRVNYFGYDTAIDLPGHSFAGGEGKRIRYSTSWLKTNNMRVEERPIEDFPLDKFDAIIEDIKECQGRGPGYEPSANPHCCSSRRRS